MSLRSGIEENLIVSLIESRFDAGGRERLLAAVVARTGARFAALLARDSRGAVLPGSRVTGLAGNMRDPVGPIAQILDPRMRAERIYSTGELQDLLGQGEVSAILRQVDADSVLAMHVPLPGKAGALHLALFADHVFRASDGAVLRHLYPFVRAAGAAAVLAERDEARAAIALSAGSNASGWFLLDAAGIILATSFGDADVPPGIQLLQSAQATRLSLVDIVSERSLGAMLHACAAQADLPSRAILLRHDPVLHLRVRAVRQPPGIWPSDAVALATLHDEAAITVGEGQLLVDMFGLLPSEARLAVALATGRSLSEAAGALGLTIETARNYSKKIYAKTGTRGQADLVRRIYANGLAGLALPKSPTG
ncbi:helix-turn-helix transcriptional regulator [Sphingosinithalassobacter portus]|uniref:helix-turn-helix transcriptional regulator n=1 Tax=Stakelama portus TaxID=2676234 RepID=UPI000D6E0959|nr:hypothetical protein [Sphingosinithalassobacter portus]